MPTSRPMGRRSFLRLVTAATGFAAASCSRTDATFEPSEPAAMSYRSLGDTGLEVSEIAFGAHGVDNAQLMRAALEAGINTFCTSGHYLDGMEEVALGRAIRESGFDRDRLNVLTGNNIKRGITKQSVLDDIDASLQRLGHDRIEVYYLGDVRSVAQLKNDAFHEAVDEAKRSGKVLHLGVSGHSGGMQAVLEAAMDDGRFEVFFIKYDFVSYPEQDELLARAAAQGIGTVVFKTNAGNRQREIKGLQTGGLSFPQATVKWALTNPAVASVAVTITSYSELQEMAAAVGTRLNRSEVAMLRRYADEMRHQYCRFCALCEPSCPRGVAIADVNRYWMYFAHYRRHTEATARYAALPRQRSVAACGGCPAPCESACPFGRPVKDELMAAHRKLGVVKA